MYEKVIFWPKTIIGEVENRFRPHYKFISSYSTNQIDIFVPICQYILTENMNEGNSVAVKLVWLYYIVTKHLTISRNQIFLYSCAFSFQKSYSKLLQPNIVYTTFQFRGIKISYKGHDIFSYIMPGLWNFLSCSLGHEMFSLIHKMYSGPNGQVKMTGL